MTTYYALSHGGRARTLLAVDRSPGRLSYRRWDLAAAAWRDDPRVLGYLSGIGGGGDVTELGAAEVERLADQLGITLA